MIKKNVWTAVSTAMLFLPWTLLLLRMNAWALESPAAETLISCYSAFMIFSGLFTLFAYTKGNVRNNLMKVCLVINSLYAAGGIAAFCMMAVTKLS